MSTDTLLPHLKRVLVVNCTARYATEFPTAMVLLVLVLALRWLAANSRRRMWSTELVEAVSGGSGLQVALVVCKVEDKALEASSAGSHWGEREYM